MLLEELPARLREETHRLVAVVAWGVRLGMSTENLPDIFSEQEGPDDVEMDLDQLAERGITVRTVS